MNYLNLISVLALFQLSAPEGPTATVGEKAPLKLTGQVLLDGSSTVYPVSVAAAETFGEVPENKSVRVSVASSGTGGGFKKFCVKEADITGASRPIELAEIKDCQKNGVSFIEVPVAYDGIAVVTAKSNENLFSTLTFAELKKIWEPESKVKIWGDISKKIPAAVRARPLKLYSPGPEHGTFDYFTKVINGAEKSIRKDITAANPEVIVAAVAKDIDALAYFGFAYYFENQSKLALLKVDAQKGKGGILPSRETIASGAYPLSRPIFIYVSAQAAERPEVAAFVNFYIQKLPTLAPQSGYVPFSNALYAQIAQRFGARVEGSLYTGEGIDSKSTASLEQRLNVANAKTKTKAKVKAK